MFLELLIVLFVLLVLVTVIGHGIWMLIAAIFRGGFDAQYRDLGVQDPDVAAFRRVVLRLRESRRLPPDEARRLLDLAQARSIPQSAADEEAVIVAELVSTATASGGSVQREQHKPPLMRRPRPGPQTIAAESPRAPDVRQSLRSRESADTAQPPHPLSGDGSPFADPLQPRSYSADARHAAAHVMRSFLIQHNIRWGELIAGLLIVVCSVGLVVSLWNTLEQTHILLPSLVFMLGTAGVEGAGLYTLARWRLRTTSRAMLVIASLLVPLNVVAGIAVTRGGDAAVSLLDPVTVATVIVSALVYSVLMWWAGRAVLGRAPWRWVVAIVGPAASLIFFRSFIAQFGAGAGWVAALPALCVVAALARERLGRGRVGSARAMRTLTLAAVAVYAAGVAVVFLGLQVHRLPGALVMIATATIPAVVFLAGWASWLRAKVVGSSATWVQLIALSITILCALVVISVFPPALVTLRYALAWCGVVALSTLLTAVVYRQAALLYGTAAASGMAIILLVPQYAYAPSWQGAGGLIQRMTGGAAGVLWLAVAIALAAIAQPLRRRWAAAGTVLLRSALFAVAVGIASAAVVSLGPQHWSHPVPIGVSWAVLGAASLAVLFAAGRQPLLISPASLLVAMFWLGWFRGAGSWPGASAAAWVQLISGAAVTTLSTLAAASLAGALLVRRPESERGAWAGRLTHWDSSQLFRWAVAAGSVAGASAVWQFTFAPLQAVICGSVIALWGVVLGLVRRAGAVLISGQLAGLIALLGLGQSRGWWTLAPENWARTAVAWQMIAVVLLYVLLWAVVRWGLRRRSYQWTGAEARSGDWDLLADRPLGYIALLGAVVSAALVMGAGILQAQHLLSAGPTVPTQLTLPPLPSTPWLVAVVLAGGAWVTLTWIDRKMTIGQIVEQPAAGLVSGSPPAAGGDDTAGGRTAAACTTAVLGVLFAAAMAVVGAMAITQTPWNVAAGASAAVLISLVLLVALRAAGRRGALSLGEEADLWPVCSVNALGWAAPVVGGWGFLVLWPSAVASNLIANASGVVVGLLLAWALVATLLWTWYRCQLSDAFAMLCTATAAVIGYAGMLSRPGESTVIHWLAVAGTAFWALAVAIPAVQRLGWIRSMQSFALTGDAAGTAERSQQPRRALSQQPALAAAVIAICVAAVAAITLSQQVPSPYLRTLPGPTASDAGFIFWSASLLAAALMLLRREVIAEPLGRASRWSLAAWVLAITSGWTALVALRWFAFGALSTAWSLAQVQLALAMLLSLYPLLRFAAVRSAGGEEAVARRSEPTLLVMIALVLAAVGFAWAQAVDRALPVTCAVFAVCSYLTLASSGEPRARERRGLLTALLACAVVTAGICWPTAAAPWGISETNIWQLLPWIAVVLAASGVYWRVIWIRGQFVEGSGTTAAQHDAHPLTVLRMSGPVWLDSTLLAFAAAAVAMVTSLHVAEFTVGALSMRHLSSHLVGESALAIVAGAAVIAAAMRPQQAGQTLTAQLLLIAPLLIVFMWSVAPVHLSAAAIWAGCFMTLALAAALFTWVLPLILQSARQLSSEKAPWDEHIGERPWRESAGYGLALALICLLAAMIAAAGGANAGVRWCWIAAAVAAGIAAGRAGAQLPNADRIRTTAAGLIASAALVGSITEFESGGGVPAVLVMLMRALVAGTIVAAAIGGLRRSLFLNAQLWTEPLRRVTLACVAFSGAAMVAMLIAEAMQPSAGAAVRTRLVIGAAVALMGWAVATLYRAIAPEPQRVGNEDGVTRWLATSAGRQTLVHVSQTLIVLTWLHIELCRPGWIPDRFRDYWPLTVMVIAFGSAALMHWAERRGPRILIAPLRRTAVLLPLVPVLGFWLSAAGGASTLLPWGVPYALVLVLVAAYYGALAIWGQHRSWTAAASVIAGNAAIWVVLSEQPGWEFLTHPQLWLIPPAASVLAAAQVERHRMSPPMLAAVRYAAMLVIYVSSTADLLVQEIGTSLSGPIVLILLALAGVIAGIILEVRAFLFLGTAFVLVAVLSMVWHAQRAIGQVWPWWAFGITTGLLLLTALMLIERFRPAVQELAARLAAWEK